MMRRSLWEKARGEKKGQEGDLPLLLMALTFRHGKSNHVKYSM